MTRRFGYQVETVDGGEAALARLEAADKPPIDCLVLDLVMPDLDGMGVLGRMRERKLTTPVIVQTAHGSIEVVISAMRAGAADFVVKPVGAEEACGVIFPTGSENKWVGCIDAGVSRASSNSKDVNRRPERRGLFVGRVSAFDQKANQGMTKSSKRRLLERMGRCATRSNQPPPANPRLFFFAKSKNKINFRKDAPSFFHARVKVEGAVARNRRESGKNKCRHGGVSLPGNQTEWCLKA